MQAGHERRWGKEQGREEGVERETENGACPIGFGTEKAGNAAEDIDDAQRALNYVQHLSEVFFV
jgi:hypothetical protein